MGEEENEGWEDQHALLLTIAWFGGENLLLWSTYLKNYKYGIIAHAFFGSVIAGLMITGALMMLISEGIG